MPFSFCGQYMQGEEGKLWERHYIGSDRTEIDIRQGCDGTYWGLRDAGHMVQVY